MRGAIDWGRMETAEDKAAREQDARRSGVKAERERRLEAGKTFTASFGAVPVTGRPFDQTVILALLQRAGQLLAAGDDAPAITYRDGANAIHELRPSEFAELGAMAMAWCEAVMAASWAMLDSGDIPADFTDDGHWPA